MTAELTTPLPAASPAELTGETVCLDWIGEQLLETWREHQPERALARLLDSVIAQVREFFPDAVLLTSLYVYRETGLLYLERVDGELASLIKTRTSHPQGAAAMIVNHRQPIFVEDLAHWPAELPPIADHLLNTAKIKAYVGLPLLIGGTGQEEVVGALLISLNKQQCFSPARRAQLWRWAREVALFVQNARVFRRRARVEEAFQAISASVTNANPDEVATVIAQQVLALTKSAFAAVLTNDDEQTVLATRGLAFANGADHTGGVRLELQRTSINAHVFMTRTPYYTTNVTTDPYYLAYPGWDESSSAVYCVPLLVQQRVIGTIYITSVEIDGIAPEDRNFVDKLAPHAAIALYHATLMREERTQNAEKTHQVDFLSKIKGFQGAIADILSLYDQVSQIRLALAEMEVNTDGFFIATHDPQSGLIRLPQVCEWGRLVEDAEKLSNHRYGPRRLGERRGLIDYVIHHDSSLLVKDMVTWQDRAQIESDYRTELRCCLVVPLRRSGQIIGVLGLRGYDQPNLFSEQELALLEAAADEMAVVLENAQKYDTVLGQLQERNLALLQSVRELHAVSEFQRNISNIDIREGEEILGADIVDITPTRDHLSIEARELQNIYDKALEAMRDVGMETGSMFIALYNPTTRRITVPLVYEGGRRILDSTHTAYRARRLGEYPHLIEWVIEHHEALLFNSRQELEAWVQEHGLALHTPERSQSWMAAPLIASNKLLGVIVVRDFERDHAFNQNHRQLLEMIAGQAAIVIENARLYERSQRIIGQLQALYQAGRQISAAGIELEDVLHAILEQATKVTGAYFATLRLHSDDGLKLLAVWPPERRTYVEKTLPWLPLDVPSVVTEAFQKNRYVLVPDVSLIDHYIDIGGETRSELAVVLRRISSGNGIHQLGHPIGILNVEHHEVNGLTREDHAGVLVGLANLAALAIRNADQAAELEEVRDYAIINEAIAWMGIFAAEKQHTMAQKIGSLRYCIDSLRAWVEQQHDVDQTLFTELLDDLESIANDLHSIRPAAPVDATLEAPTLVDVELQRTIQRWCNDHNRKQETAIECTFALDCPGISIAAPASMVQVALEKIVHNAFRAMGAEGVLTVRSRQVDGQVEIDIEDTGPGIPEFARADFLKRPIQRPPQNGASQNGANDQHTGTGMGAHMARIVARRYGGNLKLLQTSGLGTTLRLTFPIFGG
ncbi:MAG: GAF domain-containing protein [Caldilineaceae bacterium]